MMRIAMLALLVPCAAQAQDECPQDCEPGEMVGGCCPTSPTVQETPPDEGEKKQQKKKKKKKKAKQKTAQEEADDSRAPTLEETSEWLLGKLSIAASARAREESYQGGTLSNAWENVAITASYAAPDACTLTITESHSATKHDGSFTRQIKWTIDFSVVATVQVGEAHLESSQHLGEAGTLTTRESGYTHVVGMTAREGQSFSYQMDLVSYNAATGTTSTNTYVRVEGYKGLTINGADTASRVQKAVEHLANGCSARAADEPF